MVGYYEPSHRYAIVASAPRLLPPRGLRRYLFLAQPLKDKSLRYVPGKLQQPSYATTSTILDGKRVTPKGSANEHFFFVKTGFNKTRAATSQNRRGSRENRVAGRRGDAGCQTCESPGNQKNNYDVGDLYNQQAKVDPDAAFAKDPHYQSVCSVNSGELHVIS